jgi:hypothetical protein
MAGVPQRQEISHDGTHDNRWTCSSTCTCNLPEVRVAAGCRAVAMALALAAQAGLGGCVRG